MKKSFWKTWGIPLLASLILTVIFCWPYLARDFLGIEHDTFFHLSRIEGLADSISRGNWLPTVYPYKNNNFGYGSAMFYCDLFLLVPALLYNAGMSLAFCYKFYLFFCTFFSCLAMMRLVQRITHHLPASVLASAAYLFANYRITDVYVRGAVGEVTAMIFLPVLLSGLYEVMDQKNTGQWGLLALGITGLVLSHNLTFVLGMAAAVILFLSYYRHMEKPVFLSLCKAVLTAFLLSVFFTLPMIEQLSSQTFYLGYYASSSDLGSQAMRLWQYFANETVFGMGGNTYAKDSTMLENVGWFLTFAPLLYLLVPKKTRKKNPFVLRCLILGYVCWILPSDLIPWDSLAFLRVMQFPWRFNTLAIVFLSVSAGCAFAWMRISRKTLAVSGVTAAIVLEGIWHLEPALHRTFGITSETTYSDITSGKVTDPYYSATYVRVECAGGDYLPTDSPDFRTYSTAIKNSQGEDLDITYDKDGTNLSFEVTEKETGELILPVTYYKGYQVYQIIDGKEIAVNTYESEDKMVSFTADSAGSYVCRYVRTPIQIGSAAISALSALTLILLFIRKKAKQKNSSSLSE